MGGLLDTGSSHSVIDTGSQANLFEVFWQPIYTKNQNVPKISVTHPDLLIEILLGHASK